MLSNQIVFLPSWTLSNKRDHIMLSINVAVGEIVYPLSYRVPIRERYGSTLLPATREQHDQNCTQSH